MVMDCILLGRGFALLYTKEPGACPDEITFGLKRAIGIIHFSVDEHRYLAGISGGGYTVEVDPNR
jgi:hypothetical protein